MRPGTADAWRKNETHFTAVRVRRPNSDCQGTALFALAAFWNHFAAFSSLATTATMWRTTFRAGLAGRKRAKFEVEPVFETPTWAAAVGWNNTPGFAAPPPDLDRDEWLRKIRG